MRKSIYTLEAHVLLNEFQSLVQTIQENYRNSNHNDKVVATIGCRRDERSEEKGSISGKLWKHGHSIAKDNGFIAKDGGNVAHSRMTMCKARATTELNKVTSIVDRATLQMAMA